MDLRSTGETDAAPRSNRLTHLDLLALVLGCGGAFAMPLRLTGQLPPRRYLTLGTLAQSLEVQIIEWTMLTTIALVPVIVARRWRDRGVGRPAEWLVLAFAGLLSLSLADRAGLLPRLGWQTPWKWVGTPMFGIAWLSTGLFAFCLAIVIAAGKFVRGVEAALVAFLLFASWTWGPGWLIGQTLNGVLSPLFIPRGVVDSLAGIATYRLLSLPAIVMLGVPLAATITAFRRVPRPDWTWVDGVGAISVIANLVAECLILPSNALGRYAMRAWLASSAIDVGGWCLMLVLARGIQRRFAPAWSRWLGMGYAEDHPPSTPPEARCG